MYIPHWVPSLIVLMVEGKLRCTYRWRRSGRSLIGSDLFPGLPAEVQELVDTLAPPALGMPPACKEHANRTQIGRISSQHVPPPPSRVGAQDVGDFGKSTCHEYFVAGKSASNGVGRAGELWLALIFKRALGQDFTRPRVLWIRQVAGEESEKPQEMRQGGHVTRFARRGDGAQWFNGGERENLWLSTRLPSEPGAPHRRHDADGADVKKVRYRS